MPDQTQVSLRLVARESVEGWVVQVFKDGVIVQRDVPVRDPLNQGQRSTCRWYLEEYVERLPFSKDRAQEAELLLESYPEDLLRQLSLREILAPELEEAPFNLDSILLSIEVCHSSAEGGCSVDTIHRLFWETLEDPGLWSHPRLAVVVERSMSPPRNERPPHADRFDCWRQPDGTLTLNLLVVVARNMTQNPSTHDDVNPFLATDALIRVQKILSGTRKPIQIRLEMVRPGTFAAFVKHLECARAIHGEGYFHVVHFDMHGKIGTRQGKLNKYGFLSFSNLASDGITSVPGHLVGQVLEKFKIPFAVLNACESARACLGDDANIAQQFLKHGVRNVLGMSFKISASAAAIFLEAFYHALLVCGNTFSEAAAAGRSILRRDPMRPARYNRQQRRQDSFVAVTYGPGLHCVLAQSIESGQRLSTHDTIFRPDMWNASPSTQLKEGLHGRDFDLLRLEKRLLQTNAVYLYGLAGVGKSVFLKRAVSLWKSTNFVDAIVAVDFSKDRITSGEVLSLVVLRQLLSQVNVPKHQSRLWIIPSRSLESYDNDMVITIVAEIVLDIDSVLIFDSLDIPLMPHPSHLAPALSESSVAGLCQTMNYLVALSQNASEKKPRLLFANRRGDARWLEMRIGRQFGPLLYELEGLDLASAIDLSHQVLQNCDGQTRMWSYEDADHLVSIIQLLGNNPLALQDLLPLQQVLKLKWSQFYRGLHHGLFTSVADLEQVDFGASQLVQEIHHASLNLRQGHFFFICLFSLYWDEAVSVDALQEIFSATASVSLRQDFQIQGHAGSSDRWPMILLSFALDRGYIRVSNGGASIHVHPLFTVVGRAYLTAFITPARRMHLRRAFCYSLDSLQTQFVLEKQGPKIGLANLLSSVDFCLIDVPLEHWPLSVFAAFSDPTLLSALPLATRPIAHEQIFELLRLLSIKFDKVEQKERYVQFFILVLFRIVSSCEDHNQELERTFEFSFIGLCLLPSLDHRVLALDTQLYQNCLLLVQFLSIPRVHEAGPQRSWSALMSLKYELCDRLNQNGSPLPHLQQLDLLSAGTDEIGSLISSIQDAQDPTMEFSNPRNFILDIILRLLQIYGAGNLAANSLRTDKCQQLTIGSEQRAPKEQMPDLFVDIDIRQFKQMLGFDEQNLVKAPIASSEAVNDNNNALETSYESGDWIRALDHHQNIITEASNACRFEEAEQHVESMRAILTKVSAPSHLFNALDNIRRAIKKQHISYLVSCTFTPSKIDVKGYTADDLRSERVPGNLESNTLSQTLHRAGIAVEDIAMATKEFEQNPRKWWEWWGNGSSSGSGWIAQIYDNSVRYKEEAGLMNDLHGACMSNNIAATVPLIQKLEALCKDGIFVDYELHPSPLQPIMDCFETALLQSQILNDWQAALLKDDFKSAKSHLNKLSASPQSNDASLTSSVIDALYVATDRERLLDFTLKFYAAANAVQFDSCQKLYNGFLKLVDNGELSRIKLEEIMSIKSEALGKLMQQAVEHKQWKHGIQYCKEFLALCDVLRKRDLEARDACIQIQSRCEWGLIQEDLAAAEASFDFDKCLELVDAMEIIYKTQKATPGRIRSTGILLV
ncbi:hypothetical protein IFR04_012658 [Cadophora malorum]|uniref:CHAT domain-containing protein n=1 Tax=Cadophora malorum TaxID=108018 RepID=A0A8H7T744_9HELO|nr:hypothetical protein IFR04_012658 [Cadophora malorum]